MASPISPRNQIKNQIVGNVGLYYVCYRLSLLGWNVMPTSRNAKGIDILIYSQDASRTHTIQVKALSQRAPVPLGATTDNIFGNFFVICSKATSGEPECFILTPSEVQSLAHRGTNENGKPSCWLQPKHYENDDFRERWDRVGYGSSQPIEISEAMPGESDQGIRQRSTVTKPVAMVHRLCNENPGLSRKELIAKCIEQGINHHTAAKQYSVWKATGDA